MQSLYISLPLPTDLTRAIVADNRRDPWDALAVFRDVYLRELENPPRTDGRPPPPPPPFNHIRSIPYSARCGLGTALLFMRWLYSLLPRVPLLACVSPRITHTVQHHGHHTWTWYHRNLDLLYQ